MRTALIIDGNYLLSKDVFILHAMKTLHVDLQKLLRMDIDKINKLYAFDDLYFVSDSKIGYWRKQAYSGYKEKRKADINIDWKWVYEEYDLLKEYIKEETKFNQIQINYAEGDDIIAHIVNNNNKLGYSNVIIAADSDLHQLLKFDLANEYINIAYNYKFSDERVYVPENYEVFLSELKRNASSCLFDMTQDDEFLAFLEDLFNRTKVVTVETEKLLFVKLISGDKKDSIPSVFLKKTKTDKLMGIGKDGAANMYNTYKELYPDPIDFDSDDFIKRSIEVVTFVKKITDEAAPNTITDGIKRNRTLTILNEKYFPEVLNDQMHDEVQLGTKKKKDDDFDFF